MATFVLVHGAWHGGWCWRHVAALLRAAGQEVHTPTLTGCGERVHLARPDTGLDTHIQDVVAVLEYEDLRDVILVGHSYGGTPITGVADRSPGRIAHVVYLDANVPRDGDADIDCLQPQIRAWFEAEVRPKGEATLPPPVREHPFGIRDAAAAQWVNAKLTPHPIRTLTDPLWLTNPDPFAGARTFIALTQAAAGSAGVERARAESGWRHRELATGHDAMITAPRDLADLLLEIGQAVAT